MRERNSIARKRLEEIRCEWMMAIDEVGLVRACFGCTPLYVASHVPLLIEREIGRASDGAQNRVVDGGDELESDVGDVVHVTGLNEARVQEVVDRY